MAVLRHDLGPLTAPLTVATIAILPGFLFLISVGNSLGLMHRAPLAWTLGAVGVPALLFAVGLRAWYRSEGWIIQQRVLPMRQIGVFSVDPKGAYADLPAYGTPMTRLQAARIFLKLVQVTPELDIRLHRVGVDQTKGRRGKRHGSSGG
jgi:hypothetical protein